MVKVSLKPASLAQFQAAIALYAQRSKQTLKDATLEQAALACQDAATFTPPLAKGGGQGLSNAAKKAGERAIERDVYKVFEPLTGGSPKIKAARVIKRLGSLSLNNNAQLFWRVAAKNDSLIKHGNPFISRMLSSVSNGYGTDWGFKKLRNYFNKIGTRVSADFAGGYSSLQGTAAIEAIYKPIYARNLGRLWKNGKNVSGVNPSSKRLVEEKSDLDTFIAQRQERVGAIKSGWVQALKSLPKPVINGIPKNFGVSLLKQGWITRHTSVAGNSTVTATDKMADVTVRNSNGNVAGIADQAGVLGLVYGNRVKQMPASIRKRMQPDIDKFNSG